MLAGAVHPKPRLAPFVGHRLTVEQLVTVDQLVTMSAFVPCHAGRRISSTLASSDSSLRRALPAAAGMRMVSPVL